MDKSREEFETAIKNEFGDSIDYRVCGNGDGEYLAWDMQVAWWAWQASRAAVVVELPKDVTNVTNKAYEEGRDDVITAIGKAGVTVKGDE